MSTADRNAEPRSHRFDPSSPALYGGAGFVEAGFLGGVGGWGWSAALLTAGLRWASQPPLALGITVFLTLVPLLWWIRRDHSGRTPGGDTDRYGTDRSKDPAGRWKRRIDRIGLGGTGAVWVAAALYWAVTLQGLRHANVLLIGPWIILAIYLAAYDVLFVWLCRRLLARRVPWMVTALIAWTTCEWLRNYVLTGISVCMLGHSLLDFPGLVQIADLAGASVVSGLIVIVNVAIEQSLTWLRQSTGFKQAAGGLAIAIGCLAATLGYGLYRLSGGAAPLGLTVALVGLDERTEYLQSPEREAEMFQAYAAKTAQLLRDTATTIDVVVWPESMFGGVPWMIRSPDAVVPDDYQITDEVFRRNIDHYRDAFRYRCEDLQRLMRASLDRGGRTQTPIPHLIVGGGVVRYGQDVENFSGLIHIDPAGQIDWYGKNHLVLFGETIPIVSSIPWLARVLSLPAGLSLSRGGGGHAFDINGIKLAGNICIETAVQRVTIGHLRQAYRRGGPAAVPGAIVTVTNDSWFDHSSVVEHHLRCGQMLAIATRRPLLSAGNGGPTAWVDSRGRVIDRVADGRSGVILANPDRNDSVSLSVRTGPWPLWVVTIITLTAAVWPRRTEPPISAA